MQFLAVDPHPGATSTRCIAISRCCIFRCRHRQLTPPRVLSTLFFNKNLLHAISCCCMQFRVVACNFVVLFSRPAAPPPTANNNTILTQTYHHTPSPSPLPTAASTDRRAHCGYAHFTSYVAIVKDSKVVSSERMSERICEHVVDVSVPQVVEQLFVVPKISSQTESCSVPWNRFLVVRATLVVKQLVEVPKFVFQDRIQQRTLEQISDTPDPQVVEELVKVFTDFSLGGVQHFFVEQIFGIPAISTTEIFTHFSQDRA